MTEAGADGGYQKGLHDITRWPSSRWAALACLFSKLQAAQKGSKRAFAKRRRISVCICRFNLKHLDTLRATDPSAKLAAVQHALAREYGFESWPKLVHHVESLQPASRTLRPAALRSDEKLLWWAGRGTDLWALIKACVAGDRDTVRTLIATVRVDVGEW